jgi:hypothetical protein
MALTACTSQVEQAATILYAQPCFTRTEWPAGLIPLTGGARGTTLQGWGTPTQTHRLSQMPSLGQHSQCHLNVLLRATHALKDNLQSTVHSTVLITVLITTSTVASSAYPYGAGVRICKRAVASKRRMCWDRTQIHSMDGEGFGSGNLGVEGVER